MEGPGLDRAGSGVRDAQRGQTHAEFPGRPGGERHGQYLVTPHVTGVHQVRDPSGDGPGLPRTGTGEDADRPAGREYRLTLLRVETVEG
ncbi:hypothetical protein NCCP2495_04510 [Dietzia sp. NCCP-2495]|nr:hypothetical protein NCCP2495_04510 [Dietzia sp. NCCP-2495]